MQRWYAILWTSVFLIVNQAFSAAPPNDNVSAAQVVSGRDVIIHTSNVGATKEGLDPQWADNQGGHSIWYRWTAPADGLCVIDGSGTNFTLLINVCLETNTTVVTNGVTNVIPSMLVVAANAMVNTYFPVQFGATAGTTYLISLDGFWGEQGELDWSLHLKPFNDDFDNRRLLGGVASQLTDTNSGATLQPQEAVIAPSGSTGSLWYSWQAPISGQVTIQLSATNPVAIVVFTGSALTNLIPLAQSGDWTNAPIITFEAQEGEAYQIGVFGQASMEGTFNFHLLWKGLRFVSPSANSIWPAPATLPVEVRLEMPGESLKEVSVSANGSIIGNLTNPPFALNWTVPAAGAYTLLAHGTTVDDKFYESVPLTCLIYADDQLPRPRVYAGVQSDTSYVLNGVGALRLFGAEAEQFGRLSTNVLSAPFLGKWPAGVTGWKEISGSWAISDAGALYQKGETVIPFPTGVTRWKHVSCGFDGVVTVGDDGDLYLGGTSRIAVTRPPGGWRDARASLTNLNNIILGLGEDREAYLVNYTNGQWNSTLLPKPSGVTYWKAISQAAFFGVLLTDADRLWIYGMYGGVTGTSGTPGFSAVLHPLGVRRWVDFAAGGYHVMAISDQGHLYTWGRNAENQLGLGMDQTTRATPTKVERPPGVTGWSAIAAGQFHSLAIGQDCKLYAWGENSSGQLGAPASAPLVRPTRVPSMLNLCGTPIIFTDGNASQLPDGSFRLRFNTDLNRVYLIQYGDPSGVWKNANDTIVGTGEVIEWIDDGPPKTEAHPSTVTSRMYRVIYAP